MSVVCENCYLRSGSAHQLFKKTKHCASPVDTLGTFRRQNKGQNIPGCGLDMHICSHLKNLPGNKTRSLLSAIYFRVCRWVVFGITTKHCHRAKKRRWACVSWQRWPIFYCPSGFGLDFIALAGSSTIMLTVQDSRVVRLIPHSAESHKVFTVQSSPQLYIKSTFQNEYLQCVVDPLKLYFRGVLDPRTVVSRFRKGHERRR